jgi:hypothetical protein
VNDDSLQAGCHRCGQLLDLSKLPKVLEHSAAHILNDETLERTGNYCGFCLRPASRCVVKLWKVGGSLQIDFKASTCIFLRDEITLRYSSAAQSSTSSPCSNVPIFCPICNLTVWRYNFENHCRDKHPTRTTLSADTWKASAAEKASLEEVWKGIVKKGKKAAVRKKPAAVKLAISEAHSASLALRYPH